MSRKNILPSFKAFNAVDISTNQDSLKTVIQGIDNIGIIVSWAGTNPVGVLTVYVTNDDPASASPVWDALDFGNTINISGNSGKHTLNIRENPFRGMYLHYAASSGTGAMSATVLGKTVGA